MHSEKNGECVRSQNISKRSRKISICKYWWTKIAYKSGVK